MPDRIPSACQLYRLLYTWWMKDIVFVGASIDALRDFPQSARQRVGYQLHVVQQGYDPVDWKPMPTVGAGCR